MEFKLGDFFERDNTIYTIQSIDYNSGTYSFRLLPIRKWGTTTGDTVHYETHGILYSGCVYMSYEDIFKSFDRMYRTSYGYPTNSYYTIKCGQEERAAERLFLIERIGLAK